MRILVTGATGFVGSRLLERLAELGGHDLYSLQRYVTGRYVLGADHSVKVVFCDCAIISPSRMRSAKCSRRLCFIWPPSARFLTATIILTKSSKRI